MCEVYGMASICMHEKSLRCNEGFSDTNYLLRGER